MCMKTIDKKRLQIGNKFPPLRVLAEAGNGIDLLFEVEYKTASSQNCEMEVEWNHLYSLEVRNYNHV